jgi:hypothetical protein
MKRDSVRPISAAKKQFSSEAKLQFGSEITAYLQINKNTVTD